MSHFNIKGCAAFLENECGSWKKITDKVLTIEKLFEFHQAVP
jgi:hypothetical protein